MSTDGPQEQPRCILASEKFAQPLHSSQKCHSPGEVSCWPCDEARALLVSRHLRACLRESRSRTTMTPSGSEKLSPICCMSCNKERFTRRRGTGTTEWSAQSAGGGEHVLQKGRKQQHWPCDWTKASFPTGWQVGHDGRKQRHRPCGRTRARLSMGKQVAHAGMKQQQLP